MPMFDTKIPCPICHKPLTDVDGMLECQNGEYGKEWHFVYWPVDDPKDFSHCGFNFEAWSKVSH